MNDEQMRKDFEEWMGDGGLSPRALERNSVGDYILMQTAHAWEVWKAAHTHYAKSAAPVVLPEPAAWKYSSPFGKDRYYSERIGFPNDPYTNPEPLYTEQQVRELLANTKRSTNRNDESVGLREALVRAHDWMDSQADSQSKGGHATFDLMMLREERNAIKSALDEAPQPQADGLDAIATVEADGAEGKANARRLVACWNACEGIPTEALKDEAPRSCVTGTPFLQEEDQHLLDRFIETTEDNEGFDIGKEAIKRLANLGVVESLGFGRYGVTVFGYWVHEHYWYQNPSLPLKTNLDRDADARAAIAKAEGYET